jgi:ribosomal protein S13
MRIAESSLVRKIQAMTKIEGLGTAKAATIMRKQGVSLEETKRLLAMALNP